MQKAKAVDPSSGSWAEHRQAQPLSWEVGDLGTSPQPCPSVLWRFRGHWRHHARSAGRALPLSTSGKCRCPPGPGWSRAKASGPAQRSLSPRSGTPEDKGRPLLGAQQTSVQCPPAQGLRERAGQVGAGDVAAVKGSSWVPRSCHPCGALPSRLRGPGPRLCRHGRGGAGRPPQLSLAGPWLGPGGPGTRRGEQGRGPAQVRLGRAVGGWPHGGRAGTPAPCSPFSHAVAASFDTQKFLTVTKSDSSRFSRVAPALGVMSEDTGQRPSSAEKRDTHHTMANLGMVNMSAGS